MPDAADDKARSEALGAVRAVEGALAAARAQAGALDEHFRAWRATTVATRLEHDEFLLELDTIVAAQALPELADGRLRGAGDGDAGSLAALAAVQAAFDALGVMVVVTDDRRRRRRRRRRRTPTVRLAPTARPIPTARRVPTARRRPTLRAGRSSPTTRSSCACRGACGSPCSSSAPAMSS